MNNFTITNHGLKKSSSWQICHFWLLDMYILIKGYELEKHMYVLNDQRDYNDFLD
jgi:hypothetical protein